ncbi:MAG: hypothetical protein U1G07_11350 [Verrucomicrobiota bacterium]
MIPNTSRPARIWLRSLGRSLGLTLLIATVIAGFGFFRPRPDGQLTRAGVRRLTSQYVRMRDGTRIAVDVRVPANLGPGQRVPSALRGTR